MEARRPDQLTPPGTRAHRVESRQAAEDPRSSVRGSRRPLFPATDRLRAGEAIVRWLVVVGLVVAIGVVPGPERSLVWTGVATTFCQPLLTFLAAWTPWRPRTLARLGLLTVAVGGSAFVLLVLGQLFVARIDLRALPRYFPVLIAPAALLFETYLQLTMVFERKPFDRFGWRGGLLALLAAAVVAVVAYQVLVTWSALPPQALPPGFRDPKGPLSGASVATWLITVAAWQVVVMVTLNGWPGAVSTRTVWRITVNNVAVLGGATATVFAVEAAGVGPAVLAGAMGCVVAGGRLPYVLYTDVTDDRGRRRFRLLQTALWSALALFVLHATAGTSPFRVQAPGLWIAVTALNLVSGGTTYAASLVGAVRRPDRDESAGPTPPP